MSVLERIIGRLLSGMLTLSFGAAREATGRAPGAVVPAA